MGHKATTVTETSGPPPTEVHSDLGLRPSSTRPDRRMERVPTEVRGQEGWWVEVPVSSTLGCGQSPSAGECTRSRFRSSDSPGQTDRRGSSRRLRIRPLTVGVGSRGTGLLPISPDGSPFTSTTMFFDLTSTVSHFRGRQESGCTVLSTPGGVGYMVVGPRTGRGDGYGSVDPRLPEGDP